MALLNAVVTFEYAYLIAFYPDLGTKAGLSYSQIGTTMSFAAFGQIFLSIPLSKLSRRIGRKKSLYMSLFLQLLDIILAATLQFFVFNPIVFFTLASIERFIQGACRTQFIIVCCTYIHVYFPNEFEKNFGRLEMYGGFGNLMGYIIGSGLNYFMGFAGPLYVYAFIFSIIFYFLQKRLQHDTIQELKEEKEKKQLPFSVIFKSTNILLLIIDGIIAQGSLLYCTTFLVNHMKSYGIEKNITSLMIFLPGFVFTSCLLIVPKFSKIFKKQFTISFGLLLSVIGNMIMAPFWGNTNTAAPFIFGIGLNGGAYAFQRVPTVPLQMENLANKIDADLQSLSSMASSLLTLQVGITNLLVPFFGGYIYDNLGGNVNGFDEPKKEQDAFRWTILIYVIVASVVWVLCFVFADGYKGWIYIFKKCTRSDVKKESSLKAPLTQQEGNDIETQASSMKSIPLIKRKISNDTQ